VSRVNILLQHGAQALPFRKGNQAECLWRALDGLFQDEFLFGAPLLVFEQRIVEKLRRRLSYKLQYDLAAMVQTLNFCTKTCLVYICILANYIFNFLKMIG
jgi:hypothetical protein